jgi:hypothetical protein
MNFCKLNKLNIRKRKSYGEIQTIFMKIQSETNEKSKREGHFLFRFC